MDNLNENRLQKNETREKDAYVENLAEYVKFDQEYEQFSERLRNDPELQKQYEEFEKFDIQEFIRLLGGSEYEM